MTNKKAVVLNYSILATGLHADLREKSEFISHFFQSDPSLNHDPELREIAGRFRSLAEALRDFNDTVNRVGRNLEE